MPTMQSAKHRSTTILPLFLLTTTSFFFIANGQSINQVFDALDSNHDNFVSQDEFASAIGKLTGNIDGGSNGGESGESPRGGGIGQAPPLGLDSNPFAHQRINAANAAGGVGGASAAGNHGSNANNSNSNSNGHEGKFDNPSSTTNFIKGLISSFSAIMATEIGDKTFFIAAVLSMRNDRLAVFGGAILALIIMTILSTMMGLILPNLLPRKYTHIIGGILFLYFGFKLLNDSRSMEDKVSEELEEVEEELAEMNKKQQSRGKNKKKMENSSSSMGDDVEEGHEDASAAGGGEDGAAKKRRGGAGNKTVRHSSSSGISAAGDYSNSSWEAVFMQALTMTFLAEWGDRSQIATIALAASKDPVGVTIGGCMGHSVCTGMAVIGGRMLASNISEKSVAFYGGLVFLVFGVHSVFFEE